MCMNPSVRKWPRASMCFIRSGEVHVSLQRTPNALLTKEKGLVSSNMFDCLHLPDVDGVTSIYVCSKLSQVLLQALPETTWNMCFDRWQFIRAPTRTATEISTYSQPVDISGWTCGECRVTNARCVSLTLWVVLLCEDCRIISRSHTFRSCTPTELV